MEVIEKYVVFTTTRIMGTDQLSLEEVSFSGIVSNRFDTESDAIEAILNEGDKFTYIELLILKRVFVIHD